MPPPRPKAPAVCPACRKTALVDSDRPAEGQTCHFCGHVFGQSRAEIRQAGGVHVMNADGTVSLVPKKQRSEKPPAPRGPDRLLIFTGCALLVLLTVISIGWWKRQEVPPAADLPSRQTDIIPPRDHVRAIVEKFLAAKTPDELLACVRDPAISGLALRAWCAAHPGKLPLGGSLTGQAFPQTLAGSRTMQTGVQFADGTNAAFLVVETPRGWLVDWLSFTGTGDMSVAEFLEQKPPQSALLLVMAQQDSYYNAAFPAADAHRCLRLTDLGGTHTFYGYLPVENSAVAVLDDLPVFQRALPPGQDRRPLAVRARFTSPAGKEHNQAEILLIAGEGWFVP